MKIQTFAPQNLWKAAIKVSALGISLVGLTYGLVWLILSTLRVLVEGVF